MDQVSESKVSESKVSESKVPSWAVRLFWAKRNPT